MSTLVGLSVLEMANAEEVTDETKDTVRSVEVIKCTIVYGSLTTAAKRHDARIMDVCTFI